MCIYFNCRFNIKVIYIFLYSIGVFIRSLLREEKKLKFKPGFNMFSNFMSLTLCGIGYIIVLFKTKPEQHIEKKMTFEVIDKIGEDNIENQNKMYCQNVIEINIMDKNKKKYKNKKNKNFACVFIILFIANFIHAFKQNIEIEKQFKQNLVIMLEIMFLFIFSKIILNITMISHQVISIIFIFLCLITFLIETICQTYNNSPGIIYFKTTLFYFFVQLFFILGDVFGKLYLENYNDNTYLFLLKLGIFGLLLTLPIDLISYAISSENKFSGIIQGFSDNNILHIGLDILFGFLFQIGLWNTLYYFTIFHFIIIEIITELFKIGLNIYNTKTNDDKNDDKVYSDVQIYTFLILCPFIIIAILIFNENIILKCCNLNYNTKQAIINREERENNLIDENIKQEEQEEQKEQEDDDVIKIGEEYINSINDDY